jgi:hypothetical protein
MRARLPAMALRSLCTEPVPTGRNMTLAQLCCTCWALAALAELGVQGPESVLTDQLNFPSVACIDVFPASRKRCEKVSFLARRTRFIQKFPDVELNVIIFGRKGVWLLLPMCILTGFSIAWQSGYFQLGIRICDFFCVNIHVPEKAVCKSRYISNRDSCCDQSELCLESLLTDC